MIISIVNKTHGTIADEAVQTAIRAINRQIENDFAPYWNTTATLRLEGKPSGKPQKQAIADLRGDAVIYLWDKTDAPNALGYHEKNNAGIPYGFVFAALSKQLKESWSATLSHEALELIGDPEVNLMVLGPHPKHPGQTVFHWREMCDAVQADHYRIDGVDVSNFVLPAYFTSGEERGMRNDFLGRAHAGKTLRSFGVLPGGYVSFLNPTTGVSEVFANRGDKMAAHRLRLKQAAGNTRRSTRHHGNIVAASQKAAGRK